MSDNLSFSLFVGILPDFQFDHVVSFYSELVRVGIVFVEEQVAYTMLF